MPQGLVALWREALLARAVLRGETEAYRHHPRLLRFQLHAAPRSAINAYLRFVLLEAESRGYSFNRRKVGPVRANIRIESTAGQLHYEWRHLMSKLSARSPSLHRKWRGVVAPESHPLFSIKRGAVEPWERPHAGVWLQVLRTGRKPRSIFHQRAGPQRSTTLGSLQMKRGCAVEVEYSLFLNRGGQRQVDMHYSFQIGARRVIAGLESGVEGMRVGGRRSFRVGPHPAYREGGVPATIPANAVLEFRGALLSVSPMRRPANELPSQAPLRHLPPAHVPGAVAVRWISVRFAFQSTDKERPG